MKILVERSIFILLFILGLVFIVVSFKDFKRFRTNLIALDAAHSHVLRQLSKKFSALVLKDQSALVLKDQVAEPAITIAGEAEVEAWTAMVEKLAIFYLVINDPEGKKLEFEKINAREKYEVIVQVDGAIIELTLDEFIKRIFSGPGSYEQSSVRRVEP